MTIPGGIIIPSALIWDGITTTAITHTGIVIGIIAIIRAS